MTILPTTADPTEVESKIRAALSSDTTINAVIGLSAPIVGEPAVAVIDTYGRYLWYFSIALIVGMLGAYILKQRRAAPRP